jgi:translation initiation factor 2 alpha subunit (eIF-2alpha)
MPGCDGLLHVSERANYRVNNVRDEVREGERIEVKAVNPRRCKSAAAISRSVRQSAPLA